MKPVVSSLVALVLAIAPLSAMAKPAHKTAHAKVVKHHGGQPAASASKTDPVESAEKTEKGKSDKSPVIHVKADHRKHGAMMKPALHHAHNVDLGGGGHKEPKIGKDKEKGGALVAASMTTKIASHGKTAHAKPTPKAAELPRLPNPNAGKPSKGGAEKGARKPTEKKNDAAADANDGEPTRDEDFAELVARIRGIHTASSLGGIPPAGGTRVAKSAPVNVAHTAPAARAVPPCTKEPVEIVRGPEIERFELTKCDGAIAPLALERLSIMIRPGGVSRPTAPLAELAKKPGPEIGFGIHRVDPRLVGRLQALADHFSKPSAPPRLFVISGYRPASVGSMHSTGRAIDFRVDGAKNEDVVAFCKTLGDTGCGYYPNSSFVHLDVRDSGAGHVTWIDVSGPGETPRYVAAWPPPASAVERPAAGPLEHTSLVDKTSQLAEEGELLLRAQRPVERETAPESADDHPADVMQ